MARRAADRVDRVAELAQPVDVVADRPVAHAQPLGQLGAGPVGAGLQQGRAARAAARSAARSSSINSGTLIIPDWTLRVHAHDQQTPDHPPLPRRDPAGRPRRPARPPRPHPAAPSPAPGDDWDYGTPNHYLREMVDHWQHGVRLARAGGADQRAPALPHRDRRPDDPLPARPVRRADATPLLLAHTYPGSFLDFLDVSSPLTRRRFSTSSIPSMPGFGFSTPVVDRRLDDGPGRAHLRHADAPPRLRRVRRRTAATAARWSRASSALLDPPGLPRRARAAAVLVPVGRPGRVREAGARRLRGARAPAVVPVRRRLQRDQRLPPADRGRRPLRLPGRPARLERALQLLRQRHEPGEPRPDPHPGVARTGSPTPRPRPGRYHYEEAHAGPSRRSARRAPASRSSPTTSGRSRPFAERDNTNIVHWSTSSAAATTPRMEVPDVLAADLRAFFG